MAITINIYGDGCKDGESVQVGGTSSLKNGAIDPGIENVRKIARNIEQKAKEDRSFRTLFRENPDKVLAAYGLNEDIRRELSLEASLQVSDCTFLSCITTCWYTCILTDWFIAASFPNE